MRRRRLKDTSPHQPSPLLNGRIPMVSLIQTLAVAEHLNFRHAAIALGVSQSSVSARVRMLEEDLGVQLFERSTRGVRLTQAGRHFVERVAVGIDQLDHAVKTAGMVSGGEHGRLGIGVHALLPESVLSKLLRRYREKYRGIELEIVESTAQEALVQIRDGRLDVAFVAGTVEPPDCHSRRIWAEPLLAALPEGHRLCEQAGVTWADLAAETFLVCRGSTGPQIHDHIVQRLVGHRISPSILRFDVGRATLLSMAGQGFGVTLVSMASSLLPTSGVVFRKIADEPEPIAFSAVWSPHNRNPALRKLLDLASEIVESADTSGRTSP